MHKVKYISYTEHGANRLVIFQSIVSHDLFAGKMGISKNRILGAGFVAISGTDSLSTCHCYGESVSLDVKSRREDTDILRGMWYGLAARSMTFSEPPDDAT
jgi:hypothetical protein